MRYPSVLVQVVASRELRPEPVATDALVHILGRSAVARRALTLLAADLCPGLPSAPLSFRGQVAATVDSSRPDLVGSDSAGPRVVIEAKFDAALTTSQRDDTYLKRLPGGQSGLLLYVVPSDRLPGLWPQLLAGPGGQEAVSPPNLADADKPWLAHVMDDGRVVGVVSWTTLLVRLEAALIEAKDTQTRGDLEQLAGLVAWRTAEQWVPVLPGDLPDRAARQIQGLRDAVIDAAVKVSGSKTRSGTGDYGPGRWFTSPGGRKMWAGLWYLLWGRYGASPAWVSVTPKPPHSSESLYDALVSLATAGGPGLYPIGISWAVPLFVETGAEIGAVTDSFATQLLVVAELLDAASIDTSEDSDEDGNDDPPGSPGSTQGGPSLDGT